MTDFILFFSWRIIGQQSQTQVMSTHRTSPLDLGTIHSHTERVFNG